MTHTPGVPLETQGRPIETSFIDRVDFLRDNRNFSLPLMPLAWRMLGKHNQYDRVLTSSHACVKGFRPGRSALHFCYVHAPMRYVWNPEIDARASSPFLRPARAALKSWDLQSTRWVDSFAANSSTVAARIAQIYDREAVVIPPPVDVDFFAKDLGAAQREGLVAVGRLIPYKGFDLAIRIAHSLNEQLTIVGRGPMQTNLRSLAAELGANVTFYPRASDTELRHLFRASRLLLFPTVEDFGIIPVEAQAAGTPVVGPAQGGLLDTVIQGKTGVLSSSLSLDDMVDATRTALDHAWEQEACLANARTFSRDAFSARVQDWVSSIG
nr:glycosyltransferase [Nocardioides marinisabuli]